MENQKKRFFNDKKENLSTKPRVKQALEQKTYQRKQNLRELEKQFTIEEDYSVDTEKMERILAKFKPSAEPKCPLFGRCGGCQLQMLSYADQLKFKRKVVVEDMKVIGGLANTPILPVLGAEKPWNYRNKTQMPVGFAKGRVIAGCFERDTHHIIDTLDCPIQQEENNELLKACREVVGKLNIPIYNEDKHTGILRHIVGRVGRNGELMLVLVTTDAELHNAKQLVNMLRKRLPRLVSVHQNIQTYHNSVVMGRETRLLWGKNVIQAKLGPLHFTVSPRSFFQVNTAQAEVLYNTALEFAQLTGKETVIDAYCGTGTISLYLAQRARRVYGIEIVRPAILDAKRNAEANKIKNAEFIAGDATREMPKLLSKGIKADVIVVDPPRAGCTPQVLRAFADMQPERIVYVSCNPETLARDLKFMGRLGYRTEKVQPVDMFPQTFHVETVALLSGEKVNGHIDIDLDVEKIKGKAGTATYSEIKSYIEKKHGLKVSTLYIGQIKDKVGIKERKNYNKGSGKGKTLTCPVEKEAAIMDAFKHFGLV